jgi:hypothetical protein
MAADLGMAWTTGVVAFVAAVPLWRFTTHAITIAHEGGHALFALLFDRGVKHVKVTTGGGGETGFRRDGGALAIVMSFLTATSGRGGFPSCTGPGAAKAKRTRGRCRSRRVCRRRSSSRSSGWAR